MNDRILPALIAIHKKAFWHRLDQRMLTVLIDQLNASSPLDLLQRAAELDEDDQGFFCDYVGLDRGDFESWRIVMFQTAFKRYPSYLPITGI